MTATADKAATIEAHRRRYEALREQGQGETARGLPPLSPPNPPALPDDVVLEREALPGGWYWTGRLARGEALRFAAPDGTSSVAFVAWRAD